MELWIISKTNFKGTAINAAHNGIVDYSHEPLDEYLAAHPDRVAVSYEDFRANVDLFNDDVYLSKPAVEITSERFYDMLDCLPPEHWINEGGIESFRMCEYQTDDITEQYARKGTKFIVKNIRVGDKATWVSHADFGEVENG